MNRMLLPIIVVILLIVSVILFAFILRNQPSRRVMTEATITTEPTLHPSPTESLQTISGEIEDISTADYKNSTLLVIENTNVYITDTTEIENQSNTVVETDDLEEGMVAVVVGKSANGGIEAISVAVIMPTPSPTRRVQPTRTPTPQDVAPTQ